MRDRAWLTRWIKTPDKVLADNDPIAVDLYKRYKKIVMPNLRLSDREVEELITYMDVSSKANSMSVTDGALVKTQIH